MPQRKSIGRVKYRIRTGREKGRKEGQTHRNNYSSFLRWFLKRCWESFLNQKTMSLNTTRLFKSATKIAFWRDMSHSQQIWGESNDAKKTDLSFKHEGILCSSYPCVGYSIKFSEGNIDSDNPFCEAKLVCQVFQRIVIPNVLCRNKSELFS